MLYVAGFENTEKIAQGLKNMVNQFGEDTLEDTGRFISLMNDFIPEYEKERRLLKNVLTGGVLTAMRKEANQQMGITRARDLMANEMFLSDMAIEFVLVCFTYLLGWNYQSKLSQPQQPAAPAPQAAAPMRQQ
ncbi:MAG: leucine-rich repeat domain-containing protein, partial [Oscillospiraceae bacterium]|nr:leucine-rich repeat domain-containing protein [Oscillospiraceae bacterium]